MSGMPFEQRLGQINWLVAADRSIVAKLEAVAAVATRLIEGCEGAGFALEIRGGTRSLGVTDDVVLAVDLVQYDTGEGPCLQAIRESNVVRLDVLEADATWRHFAPGALERGVRSVLSVPVVIDETVGALNLYSGAAGVFDDAAEATGRVLAAYAADVIASSWLYISSVELVEDVLAELAAHETINVAVGIVMSREGCSEIEAARRLAERGERRGQALLETAEWELREQQLRNRGVSEQRGTERASDPGAEEFGSESGERP